MIRCPAPSRLAMRLVPSLFAALALACAGAAASHPRSAGRIAPPGHVDARGPGAPASRLLRGSAGAPLAPPTEGSPEAIAHAFACAVLHVEGDVKTRSVVRGGGSVTFVTLEQSFGGVPVALGRVGI